MTIPGNHEVRRRLGEGVSLEMAPNWVTGRQGLVWFVTSSSARSVFKWIEPAELVVYRDLLPASPLSAPRLLRWWPADGVCPAAIEIEHIPHLASVRPRFRFHPETAALTDPAWLGERLDVLVTELATMHMRYAGGRGLEPYAPSLTSSSPQSDWATWQENDQKLDAIRNLPGAPQWLALWRSHEVLLKRTLEDLYRLPLAWCWGDVKWDHLGCRASGEVVLLEWSHRLMPPGNDFYLLLFLPPQQRDRLLARYLAIAAEAYGGESLCRRGILLGLLRTCLLYGPGQACLSLRGFAGGGSSEEDRIAWGRDAQISAAMMSVLSGELNST